MRRWSVSHVYEWLQKGGTAQILKEAFRDAQINGEALLLLDEPQLRTLVPDSLPHRQRLVLCNMLTRAINYWRLQGWPGESGVGAEEANRLPPSSAFEETARGGGGGGAEADEDAADVSLWGVQRVCEWLHEKGIDDAAIKNFAENEVNGVALLLLEDDELVQLGVGVLGPKLILTRATATWKEKKKERGGGGGAGGGSGGGGGGESVEVVRNWTSKQLCEWMEGKGIRKDIVDICKEAQVGGDWLLFHSHKEELQELGITALGPVAILSKARLTWNL